MASLLSIASEGEWNYATVDHLSFILINVAAKAYNWSSGNNSVPGVQQLDKYVRCL